MAEDFTEEDDDLLSALDANVEPEKKAKLTVRQERIIAGFEDLQRFHDENGRAPQHGEGRDIFERLYAVRLDRIRSLEECRSLVEGLDHQGLLAAAPEAQVVDDADLDDDRLLEELGVDAAAEDDSVTRLRHVRPFAEKRAAEEIANREPCRDFATFKPLFEKVQEELDRGLRETARFSGPPEFQVGRFYILSGQKAYIAEKGEPFRQQYGDYDARLRVIFDNGTESNLLMRSLQRALTKDEAGRRITEPHAGPLFAHTAAAGDQASGTIYVLRSASDHPTVSANRELVHKIGVTNSSVEKRIAGAHLQPTFLMADVEVVATYELYNINRTRLENLIHRIFEPARLDIEIRDRFGKPVMPREWFLVPLFVIDEAVEKIRDGTITDYVYDQQSASLKLRHSDTHSDHSN